MHTKVDSDGSLPNEPPDDNDFVEVDPMGRYGQAASMLSDGSELMLSVRGPGIVGGLFLPILGALPNALLIMDIVGQRFVSTGLAQSWPQICRVGQEGRMQSHISRVAKKNISTTVPTNIE